MPPHTVRWISAFVQMTDFSFLIFISDEVMICHLRRHLGDFMHIYFARRFFDLEILKTLAATLVELYFDSVMLFVLGTIILFNGNMDWGG